jgi:hypothetical protein
MGTFKKGILGSFKGQVGSVIGSNWRDITVMRSRPDRKKKGSASAKQLVQQARFTMVMNFLQPLTDLLNLTFDPTARSMSGFNKAFSSTISNAIVGTYPDFAIDYSKVLLSKGGLSGVGTASCTSAEAGKLVFAWTDNTKVADRGIDLVFLAAYYAETKHWVYHLGAAQRNAGTATLDVSGLSGKSMQTWLGFITTDGSRASDSFYSGAVTVA